MEVNETETETDKRWRKSLASLESARTLALVRLAEVTSKHRKKQHTSPLTNAVLELARLLQEASPPEDTEDRAIITLIDHGLLVLRHPAVSAWEAVHALQQTFWLTIASFVNDGSVSPERRRRVLLEQVLDPDHLVQLASREEGRSAWDTSLHPASLQLSCEFVNLLFRLVDLLRARVLECLEEKRRPGEIIPGNSPLATRHACSSPAEHQRSRGSFLLRKFLAEQKHKKLVRIGPHHQAEVPAYAPDTPVLERCDVLIEIEFVPLLKPPSTPDTSETVLNTFEPSETVTTTRLEAASIEQNPPPLKSLACGRQRRRCSKPIQKKRGALVQQLSELTNQQSVEPGAERGMNPPDVLASKFMAGFHKRAADGSLWEVVIDTRRHRRSCWALVAAPSRDGRYESDGSWSWD